jgi:hypothetical protein
MAPFRLHAFGGFMKFLLIIAASLVTVSAYAATPCQTALDKAIQKPGFKTRIQTTTQVAIGDEPLVEVSQIVLRWRPDSDTNSLFYYLVSATCRTGNDGLELYDDMPGEGGVTVKTITKGRY